MYIHIIQLACFTYEYKCVYVYVQYKQPEYKAKLLLTQHIIVIWLRFKVQLSVVPPVIRTVLSGQVFQDRAIAGHRSKFNSIFTVF